MKKLILILTFFSLIAFAADVTITVPNSKVPLQKHMTIQYHAREFGETITSNDLDTAQTATAAYGRVLTNLIRAATARVTGDDAREFNFQFPSRDEDAAQTTGEGVLDP